MLCSKQFIIENRLNLSKQNSSLTYGKFKLTEAYKQLIDNLRRGYIDKSLLWSIQINISYEFNRLNKKLIDFYFSDINISNPNVIHLIYSDNLIYNLEVLKFYKNNKDILSTYHNHQIIRNHLAQFVSVLTLSDKKKIPSLEKIKDEHFNFNLDTTRQRIKYSGNNLSNKILKNDDNQNIKVPVNEILNILLNNDHQIASQSQALFWLAWIYEYDKRYKTLYTTRKLHDKVNDKYLNDVSWILWEIILYFDELHNLQNNIIKKMLDIYADEFKPSNKSRKKNIIIMAFLLLLNTNSANHLNKPLYNNYQLCMQNVMNINPLYEKVKNI